MFSKTVNPSLSFQLARIAIALSAVLLLTACTPVQIVSAQSLRSIDRTVWDFDRNEGQSGTATPKTILAPGTGKRKITGKKSIRGKQIRGKKSPSKSRRSGKAYRPKQFEQSTAARDFPVHDFPVSDFPVRDQPRQLVDDQPRKSTGDSTPKKAKGHSGDTRQTGKQAPEVREAFETLAASMEKSVTQIVDQRGRSVLGTVVSSDGLIVSKNSLVDRNGRCVFSDGQEWPYNVIATDKQRDLCLIEVKRRPTVPVKFDDLPGAGGWTVPGTISVSIGRNRTVAAWGVVTLPSYDFQINQTDGFELGALLSAFPVSSASPGVKVLRVSPRTLAEQMGLLVGDQILSLNGRRTTTREQIETTVRNLSMGDLITASTIDRMGRRKQISHRASAKGNPSMHDRWGGGPYSKRRFGFGRTLVHDSVLNPENCGGPLVGLEGELLGVNIARSMRVASLAIGSNDVLNFVKSHQPNAKLRLASLEDANLKLARISKPSK